ncbi:MAG: hypothetical protein KF722_15565 [Nitrospira sp.]|nr:hypothetical protein [Nitrospira sp.]
MDYTTNPVTFRIVWCRRQRIKAWTDLEVEAWRAEEEGLRDAVLRRDHVTKYRRQSPVLFERYVLGFQDEKALMRVAQVNRFGRAAMEEDSSYIRLDRRVASTN